MKRSEIRPHTTYIGRDGLRKKVKSISMNITGELSVEWKAVSIPRSFKGTTWAVEPIGEFARWAVGLSDTLSDDLKHYLESK